MTQQQKELLCQIRTRDFAAIEASLYLDVYNCCPEALEYFKETVKSANELKEQYEKQYGPLIATGVMGDCWSWVSDPWPWEMEAN